MFPIVNKWNVLNTNNWTFEIYKSLRLEFQNLQIYKIYVEGNDV